jgi:hypothetical protein
MKPCLEEWRSGSYTTLTPPSADFPPPPPGGSQIHLFRRWKLQLLLSRNLHSCMRPKTESPYKAVKTSRESVWIRITGKKLLYLQKRVKRSTKVPLCTETHQNWKRDVELCLWKRSQIPTTVLWKGLCNITENVIENSKNKGQRNYQHYQL